MRKNRRGTRKGLQQGAKQDVEGLGPCHSTNNQGQRGHGRTPPPRRRCSGARRPRTRSPPPPPRTWNTVPTPIETLSPQSMCDIAQALKDKCKGSVFLNTTIPQKQKNCDTVLQPCSLCQCVGASGQGKKGKEDIMQGQDTYFKNKKKQGFCMKMERKHFAGPRNISHTKRQGFCVVFLSILKIWTIGPTTGH